MRLAVGAEIDSPEILRDERIIPVEQRGKSLEQGRQLFVLEQPRGDDELTRPAGNQAGIGLDQLFDLRLRGAAVVGSNIHVSGVGGRYRCEHGSCRQTRLIRDFRSHVDLLGCDGPTTIVRSEAV